MTTGGRRRERKVVSVLFCDLVGFTSQAESLDPEDVEAILRPYHARVRSELEHYGGTVEKFIGDAVMALFGAPIAHEDDPERAVRAALAIREFAVEDGLELRIGITTGEVLVSLDASPAEGEGMASGDVVNTAARLQGAAAVNGVLADETTYRATRHVVDYAEASPVEAKGKSHPISVWEAAEVRARPGVDVAHEARSELVGREQELGVLRDALTRVRSARTSQLVTLVGVPGLGKSRLVYELSQIVEADPELITWRQGRSVAYGNGVTLWALGEIVKAQAGIHEQDPPAEAGAKLRRAVEDTVPSSGDVTWVASNLLALIGLAPESELGGDHRGEAFSAWRLFFESMADQRPLVLVFEDLHWADDGLLDFVDELVDWVTDVPLLVVATARPELLERRPGWGGGKLNSTTLALQPLSDDESARLIGNLLERPLLVAGTQRVLLERAGGNPLYAEQFAELFRERGSVDGLPLPETLQGLIAARLDGLPPDEKELLHDGAVVGKVFWIGALGRDDREAVGALHSLERKGFVRRQRRSSVEGEGELAFAHALVRDVAYSQIARADKIQKHRRIAEWIEGLGRPEDHAEMLAYHWGSALTLAKATGGDVTELEARTRVALDDAGARAFALNAFAAAERYYTDAISLTPTGDRQHALLLLKRGHSIYEQGDERCEPALEEARDALLASGDRETAGEAESILADALWYRGRRDLVEAHVTRAEELVSAAAISVAKARVLATSARIRMLADDYDHAIRVGRQALAIAEELVLPALQAHALNTVGSTMFFRDRGGQAEMQRALELARDVNSPEAVNILGNLAEHAWVAGDVARAHDLRLEGEELALRLGNQTQVRFFRTDAAVEILEFGEWAHAEKALDDLMAAFERSPQYSEPLALLGRADLRRARGDLEGAFDDSARALARAREIEDLQVLVPALVGIARITALGGRDDEARSLAAEALDLARANPAWSVNVGRLAVVADRLGVRSEARELVDLAPDGPWKRAALAGLEGDFRQAAEIYDGMGLATLAAESRFAAGERLIEQGQRAEGELELSLALEFYRSVGASYYVERGEALAAQSESA
jgi:class 3 adenylate cyclase/tetratricopeptide (TPR) repeat protein